MKTEKILSVFAIVLVCAFFLEEWSFAADLKAAKVLNPGAAALANKPAGEPIKGIVFQIQAAEHPAVSEKELLSFLKIMEQKDKPGTDAWQLMIGEGMSLKRMSEVLTDIEAVLPYAQNQNPTPAAVAARKRVKLPPEAVQSLGMSRANAIKYLDKRGGESALAAHSALIGKYADRLGIVLSAAGK